MGSSSDHAKRRGRVLLVAALIVTALAAVAGVAFATGILRPQTRAESATPAEQLAQDRCQSDVLDQLLEPEAAQLSDVRAETSNLEADGKDLFALTLEEPLKGVDTSRITVLNVSGVVNATNEFGSTINDPFDCRAYFVDGSLEHTLVLFNHGH